MEFCLHYNGHLKSKDNATGKHAIRRTLHEQVKSICSSRACENVFKADLQGTRRETEEPMYIEHAGKRFWFLISDHLATIVDVSITLLVPERDEGLVKNGGDIDNRIKTLFDALRVPVAASEIPNGDDYDYGDNGMFCLLQDDGLIGRVNLQSYRDHAPIDNRSVHCVIECKTKVTRALWGNLMFA